MRRSKKTGIPMLVAVAALILALWAAVGPGDASRGIEAAQPAGFRALSGPAAQSFALPADVRLAQSLRLDAYGLTYERYQQYAGFAQVLGGQLTLYRDDAGNIVNVVGSHYPGIAPANAATLSHGDAAAVAGRDIGPAATRNVDLMIDPASGRLFFRVESRTFDSRWFHWIDASNGGIINRYNGIETDGTGVGVKDDAKDLTGVTTSHGSSGHGATGPHYDLSASDGRQITYDARNRTSLLYYVTDSDDVWNLVTSNRASPGQPALIDAQYYANVADDYYQSAHGLNWLTCTGKAMSSVGHYSKNYNNAFWNGTYLVYGDGDGTTFRELSGGLDVVAHESAHAVTDCTSALVYQDESGALNEAFSDMMGNSAEFFANELNATNCVRAALQSSCADWLIGEDVYLPADDQPGFRNMSDPAEDGDPDHYSERQIGGGDNGGVHSNSGIPNHAYYLLVNGGQNAGCARGHSHCADDGGAINVSGVGLAAAERIFFLGFSLLTQNATMCEARAATEAVAGVNQPSVANAWRAVGLTDSVCGLSTGPTATPTPTATATETPTAAPTATATPTPPPGTPGTMHVGSLAGVSGKLAKGSWQARVTVSVHDSVHGPVDGATVTLSWSTGAPASSTCTTAADGTCTATSGTIARNVSTVTATVSNITGTLTYTSADNHQTSVVVAK
jgi:Zn-dependent metalloprotease